MAEYSEIQWTDATFNPWIGCTRISPACNHCYAARDNARRGWVPGWGTGIPRKRTKTWNEPQKWNRAHDEFFANNGRHRRVFCASLADVFDNEAPDEWRADLWVLIRETPNLRWILLTKRIGNARKMLPPDWPFPNAGLMATLANQEEWDRDYPKLMRTPATWRGVSAEPLLGFINIEPAIMKFGTVDWIITGGESGPKRRKLDMDAVRVIRDQCETWSIAFYHKQNGGLHSKDAGCLVDGIEHKNFPEALAA